MMWRTDKAQRRDEALLVAFAARLCADAADVEMRPEFRVSLRSTLLAEAPPITAPTAEHTPRSAHRARPARRRMALATGLVTAILGLAGMVTVSANALPGEALYPVKRIAERAEMAFHRASAQRGAFHLELADRRLDEATRLFDRGPAFTDLGVDALEEFDQEAVNGSDALVEAYRDDNSRASIAALKRFSEKAMRQLGAMQSKLVDVELPQVTQARARLTAIAAMSARLCPDCGGNTVAQAFSEPRPTTAPKPSARPATPSDVATSASTSSTVGRITTTRSSRTENDDNSDDESDPDGDPPRGSSRPVIPGVPSLLPKPQDDHEDKNKQCSSGNLVVDLVDCVDDLVDPIGGGLGINLDDD